MTHISPSNESGPSFGVSVTKGSTHQKTDAFENALSKALGGMAAPEMDPMSPHGLGEIASKDLTLLSSSDIVSEKTDNLLALLEAYASQLEDPNVSLKNLSPVLEEIKDQAGTLLKEAERLPGGDADLKKIASHTIIAAQTEYLKFQRGDYLS